MRTTTRKYGALVTPLDLSKYIPDALKMAQEDNPEFKFATTNEYAYAVDPNGTQYVITTEGVGYIADPGNSPDDQPVFTFAVYCTEQENQIAMLPAVALTLTPDEVAENATGDPVDLADYVRVFGARLERNFDLWYETLTGDPA